MSEQDTRSASLKPFLTGATSDGGAQTDPDASLGNFRSSTRADSMGIKPAGGPNGLRVDFASRLNGPGAGALSAVRDDEVAWTPPGGTQGPSVVILNGETKILEGGGSGGEDQYLEVTRDSVDPLVSTATVTLTEIVNNLFGMTNIPDAEASAGVDKYRAIMLKVPGGFPAELIKYFVKTLPNTTQQVTDTTQLPAAGAGTITTTGSFADRQATGYEHIKDSGGTTREIVYYDSSTDTALSVPASGRGLLGTTAAAGAATDTVDAVPGIRLAKEVPSSQPSGFIQTIANENTAPTAVTFKNGTTPATGVDVGTLDSPQQIGLWIHLQGPAANIALPLALNLIGQQFDAPQ